MQLKNFSASVILGAALWASAAPAADYCVGYGPQTPRDISARLGANTQPFAKAPSAVELNLCNIHFHTQAEHKGPGFSIFAGATEHGGYRCNETPSLSETESAPFESACKGLKPGDTIEVHWVHSSCQVGPGAGLGACLSDACINPQLRVESQVFLVVNDETATDFLQFDYVGAAVGGRHQAKATPTGTGAPVEFAGSTTGPKYTEKKCSPLQVTWSVRPNCAKISIQSLSKWCENNVFGEDHPHGVRQLVTTPELLAPIK